MRNGKYFETEPGVEIYYETSGSGSPIIFVPGWTYTTEVFDHQVEHFAQSYQVVSFDPRSQGRSTITLEGNDYETQASDLAKLICHLGLKEPVIVGWSYGCLSLWGLVRLQGMKNIKGLVFIDLPPVPVSVKDEWVEMSLEQASEFYLSLTTSKGHRERVTYWVKNTMVQRELSAEELDWIVGQSIKSPPWITTAYCAAGMFSNYEKESQEIDNKLKTLFIVAEESADKARDYLGAKLPNADTCYMGGHFMFWEFPDEFNAALEKYMDRL
jgi:pimeloyl-ACP methyl ester carboxylesterase